MIVEMGTHKAQPSPDTSGITAGLIRLTPSCDFSRSPDHIQRPSFGNSYFDVQRVCVAEQRNMMSLSLGRA